MVFGSNTLIADFCYFISWDHVFNRVENIVKYIKVGGDIIVGNHCWFAQNVTVLKSTFVCDFCIFGAKSLVKGQYNVSGTYFGVKAILKQ